MHADIWKHHWRSWPRELKGSMKEVHVDTHCLGFESDLAKLVLMLDIWGERGTCASGCMSKPVLCLLALKDLLSRPGKGLIYSFKEIMTTLKNHWKIIVTAVPFSSGHDPNVSSLLSAGEHLHAKEDFWAAKREKDLSWEQDTGMQHCGKACFTYTTCILVLLVPISDQKIIFSNTCLCSTQPASLVASNINQLESMVPISIHMCVNYFLIHYSEMSSWLKWQENLNL